MSRPLTKGQRSRMMTAVLAAVVACAHMPAAAQPEPDNLNDKQILAIAIALNEGTMMASRVATDARQDDIRRFAARTLMEHSSVVERLDALQIERESHPLAEEFSENAHSVAALLAQSRRRNFDAAFIDAQVELLQSALDTIQETLIPGVRSRRLRGVLEQNKMVLVGQLGEARYLRATVESAER